MRYEFLLVFLLVFAGCHSPENDPSHVVTPSQQFDVQKIDVLQGHEFDITLSDGRRIHAFLAVTTPSAAKAKVVDFINHSAKPRCVVLEAVKGHWTIDLYFENAMMTESGQSLTAWLREQKLVWE